MCFRKLFMMLNVILLYCSPTFSNITIWKRGERNSEDFYNSLQSNSTFFTLGRNNSDQHVYCTNRNIIMRKLNKKHYEMLNLLWRKTNITTANKIKEDPQLNSNVEAPLPILRQSPLLRSTTTDSAIEFYYSNEKQEQISNSAKKMTRSNKDLVKPNASGDMKRQVNTEVERSIAFDLNDPSYKKLTTRSAEVPYLHLKAEGLSHPYKFAYEATIRPLWSDSVVDVYFKKSFIEGPLTTNMTFNRTVQPQTLKTPLIQKDVQERGAMSDVITSTTETEYTPILATTMYDKVRFFEIHDPYTDEPKTSVEQETFTNDKITHFDDISNKQNNHSETEQFVLRDDPSKEYKELQESVDNESQIFIYRYGDKSKEYAEKITLEDIDQDSKKTNVRFVKKEKRAECENVNVKETQPKGEANRTSKRTQGSRQHRKILHQSRKAPWKLFSFMGVYVYEPYHIHCDAAAISPHWLVASGACLSRHGHEHTLGAQSAFVAYCGENWRQPNRVTYVKSSIVHPRFHPDKRDRKHLFNIGIIQVVNSMPSACPGWAPVEIMSHQYHTPLEGKNALAIGWGVDRYGVKYNSDQLPSWPLMAYAGLMYSSLCPGNEGYSQYHRASSSSSSMYCLSLPEYGGEQHDPVHGGILLVDGKLVGLYLQEERHTIGEQSAIYTGVWRLIPWVFDVAVEPEGPDLLSLE